MNAHAPIILGDRQERFCQQILAGKSQTEAYRIAYGASQKAAEANGSRLIRHDRVIARIEQLRAHNAAAQRITLPFLTGELLATAHEARTLGLHGAATSAYATIGKMHGLMVDKVSVDIAVRKPSASPDSPDDMSESEWLESAGLVIEHMVQSHDQAGQAIEASSPIDQATDWSTDQHTPGLHPETGAQPGRDPGAKRSHHLGEIAPGENDPFGDPPPPLVEE